MQLSQSENKGGLGHILFVDDEINILKSLRRAFMQANLNLFIASNPEEAFDVLRQDSIDLIVSDYKMPGMNGLQFLQEIKNKYPSIIRVMLSGYVDNATVLKALTSGLVTTFFSKPWDNKVLIAKINHLLQLKKRLNNKYLLELFHSIQHLPSIPTLYQEFLDAIHREANYKELAGIVNKDVSIATEILRISNSAYFGGGRTASVEQAIMILGINIVKDIVITLSLFKDKPLSGIQYHYFNQVLKHSSLVNFYMPKVYKILFEKPLNTQFTSVGITHDIGKIILLQYFPERYNAILQHQKQEEGMGFYESEIALGYRYSTHTEIGAYLLDLWNFPQVSIEAALFHHSPEKGGLLYPDTLMALLLTNAFVNGKWNDEDDAADAFQATGYQVDDKELRESIITIRKELSRERDYQLGQSVTGGR